MNTQTQPKGPAKPSVKKTAAAPTAESTGIPVVEAAPKAEAPKRWVGVFNPSAITFPSHETLVAILTVMGLQTRLIAAENEAGDLLDEAGNTVLPAALRPYFATPEVQAQ